jgi:hypothetical protein
MVDRGSLSSGKKSLSCGQAMLKGGLSAAGGAQWSLLLSTFMLSATAALYSAPQARPSCTLGQVAWPGCVAVGISRVAQDVCEPRLFSDTLVVFVGGLRLRGGSGAGGSGADSGMRDDAEEASQLDSEGARESVLANVQSTCFGRSEFFNISVDPDMLVKDLKRELHANFSSLVCDPEQMEVWWSGMELKGLSHDSLRSYGFGQHSTHGGGVVSGSAERLIVKHKFIFSPQFAGESTERQQQRGGMSLGFGGQQAQVAAMHNARMHALLQDPAELNKLMQSPEFKQILASNPEVFDQSPDLMHFPVAAPGVEVHVELTFVCMYVGYVGMAGWGDVEGPRDVATDNASSDGPSSNAVHARTAGPHALQHPLPAGRRQCFEAHDT